MSHGYLAGLVLRPQTPNVQAAKPEELPPLMDPQETEGLFPPLDEASLSPAPMMQEENGYAKFPEGTAVRDIFSGRKGVVSKKPEGEFGTVVFVDFEGTVSPIRADQLQNDPDASSMPPMGMGEMPPMTEELPPAAPEDGTLPPLDEAPPAEGGDLGTLPLLPEEAPTTAAAANQTPTIQASSTPAYKNALGVVREKLSASRPKDFLVTKAEDGRNLRFFNLLSFAKEKERTHAEVLDLIGYLPSNWTTLLAKFEASGVKFKASASSVDVEGLRASGFTFDEIRFKAARTGASLEQVDRSLGFQADDEKPETEKPTAPADNGKEWVWDGVKKAWYQAAISASIQADPSLSPVSRDGHYSKVGSAKAYEVRKENAVVLFVNGVAAAVRTYGTGHGCFVSEEFVNPGFVPKAPYVRDFVRGGEFTKVTQEELEAMASGGTGGEVGTTQGPRGQCVEVEMGGGTRVLFSYKTPVAAVIGGTFFRTEKSWSSTTSRHISAWRRNTPYQTDGGEKPQEFFDQLGEEAEAFPQLEEGPEAAPKLPEGEKPPEVEGSIQAKPEPAAAAPANEHPYFVQQREVKEATDTQDPEVILKLARSPFATVIIAIIKNKITPTNVLDYIWKRSNIKDSEDSLRAQNALLERPDLPEAIIRQMYKSVHADIRKGVASNPSTPEEIQLLLAKDSDDSVRKELATATDSEKVLQELSHDEDLNVRQNVASNPGSPEDVLVTMLTDEAFEVVKMAAQNRSLPEGKLSELALSKKTTINLLTYLLQNSSLPAETVIEVWDRVKKTKIPTAKQQEYVQFFESLLSRRGLGKDQMSEIEEYVKVNLPKYSREIMDSLYQRQNMPLTDWVKRTSTSPKHYKTEDPVETSHVKRVNPALWPLRQLEQAMETTKTEKLTGADFKRPEFTKFRESPAVKYMLEQNNGSLTLETLKKKISEFRTVPQEGQPSQTTSLQGLKAVLSWMNQPVEVERPGKEGQPPVKVKVPKFTEMDLETLKKGPMAYYANDPLVLKVLNAKPGKKATIQDFQNQLRSLLPTANETWVQYDRSGRYGGYQQEADSSFQGGEDWHEYAIGWDDDGLADFGLSAEAQKLVKELKKFVKHTGTSVAMGTDNLAFLLWKDISSQVKEKAVFVHEIQSDWPTIYAKIRDIEGGASTSQTGGGNTWTQGQGDERRDITMRKADVSRFVKLVGGPEVFERVKAEIKNVWDNYPTKIMDAFLSSRPGYKIFMYKPDAIKSSAMGGGQKSDIAVYKKVQDHFGFQPVTDKKFLKIIKNKDAWMELQASLESSKV